MGCDGALVLHMIHGKDVEKVDHYLDEGLEGEKGGGFKGLDGRSESSDVGGGGGGASSSLSNSTFSSLNHLPSGVLRQPRSRMRISYSAICIAARCSADGSGGGSGSNLGASGGGGEREDAASRT